MKRYSILQKEKKCYVCGSINTTTHEVYYGVRNRKKSIEDGCCVYLCPKHHNMSDEGIHFNTKLNQKVKEEMEVKWLETYDKTIDDFIARYGRNYL